MRRVHDRPQERDRDRGDAFVAEVARRGSDVVLAQGLAHLPRVIHAVAHAEPVLLVGDDHGSVSCLKLSPNLRWTAVTKAEAERKAKEEAEAAAASGPRRGAAPRKAAADDDSAPADPFVLERMKSEKIAEAATKNIVD